MIEKPAPNIIDFDPHFEIFQQLMSFRVSNILLISSAYDAFILEEEGSIAIQVIREYQGLNLSGAPLITRVSSVEEALRKIQHKKFDLVITTPFLRGVNGFDIGMKVKQIAPTLPVILMAHNLHSVQLPRQEQNYYGIDNIFLWSGGAELLVAVIKNVEDHANVTMDTARAMVRVIIYVEDSPADRSFFLPLIYREIVRQTQAVLDESINEKHRLLKMRARPKVLMATNYEEALSLYESYKPFVFSIISDTRFSLGDEIDGEAGVKLLRYAREQKNDLPLLLLSTETGNAKKAAAIPAVFVDKKSPTLQDELHQFFLDYLGFGDFIFRLPDETEIGRAATLGEFEKMLKEVPDESLQYHAARNHFSNWIMARAEVVMARHLHREQLATLENTVEMRRDLVNKVHALRKMRQMGVVAKFKPERYDPKIMDFVKIGDGAIGGKARGLAFMWARLQSIQKSYPLLAEMAVTVPRTCVIAANGFRDFIDENGLSYAEGATDAEIEERFLSCSLPGWLRRNLKILTDRCRFPLSVRSSSLLEDGLFRPYAGLYETYFLHNTSDDDTIRLVELENAVKLIYASTWFASPQAFARSTGSSRVDAMAVIIQEVVGSNYGDFYYPAVSGVAQSHNYYPIMNMAADEGIAHIALGLGKTVVEGQKSLRFSPAHPERIVQFSTVDDILENSQRSFYALDVSEDAEFVRKDSNLVLRSIEDAEDEHPVQLLSSTYLASEHRIRDGFMPGMHLMTFAQMLKYDIYPIAGILRELLDFGRNGMGCEIEIEFAVNLGRKAKDSVFYLLQMRPMVTGGEDIDVEIDENEKKGSICYSTQCLGHGKYTQLADIVVVRQDTFDPAKTREIAKEISELNSRLENESRPYILIGPGRWGSADHWLGIPVQWSDISGVGAMVEIRSKKLKADPSQGSHFFQNITSLGIPYITVNDDGIGTKKSSDYIDWQWFDDIDPVESTQFLHHIRIEGNFLIKCNSKTSESVILYPGDERRI